MMLIYVFFCALAGLTRAQTSSPAVNTTEGVVIGANATDGNYYVFYGIPYAGSSSGVNRFKGPTPAVEYPSELHATGEPAVCAQLSDRGLTGVEDCLKLNIFTNDVTSQKPVLVFLQGEEYTKSDNQLYSYKSLVTEGIVVVAMNYRLSIFGFLCLGVSEAPGNVGLKDVIQGLKWIKENIAGFGGNPNNVILFGHGSGAAMVDLITLSPLAENLVHKAIAQSGSALAPWAVAYDPVGSAEIVGAKLGYSGKSRQDLAQHLAETDITLLATALQDAKFTNNTPLFAPCIENKNLNPNDTFISDAPINLLKAGTYNHIPFIYGYTNREGTMRAEQAISGWLEKMQANFTEFLQVDLNPANNATALSNKIREFYFSQRAINMETIEDYLDYHGDTLVLVSVIRGAWERGLTSKAEVRLYEFAYKGTFNTNWQYTQIPLTGVQHGGVLNYLFDFDLTPADSNAKTSLIARYTSFAKTGVPSLNNVADWLPVTSTSFNYFYYGGESISPRILLETENRLNPHSQRMSFWNGIYTEYYHNPNSVSSAGILFNLVLLTLFCQLFVVMF